jgi:hypothetical protein
MGQKGLLRALLSSQLVSVKTLPQNILYHLLVNLPSGMPVQTAALLQKVKRLLGKATIVTHEMGIQIIFLTEYKGNNMLCCYLYLIFLNSTVMLGYHHFSKK